MAIGTSDGEYFDSEIAYLMAQLDKAPVSKKIEDRRQEPMVKDIGELIKSIDVGESTPHVPIQEDQSNSNTAKQLGINNILKVPLPKPRPK